MQTSASRENISSAETKGWRHEDGVQRDRKSVPLQAIRCQPSSPRTQAANGAGFINTTATDINGKTNILLSYISLFCRALLIFLTMLVLLDFAPCDPSRCSDTINCIYAYAPVWSLFSVLFFLHLHCCSRLHSVMLDVGISCLICKILFAEPMSRPPQTLSKKNL